ncbi:MAG: DUF3048 C-terminal domain-containing protein [Anaerolineales bacterium]|nr:DUF3048 C-terminal domain-containing protein [Anaerolineales bacterium]
MKRHSILLLFFTIILAACLSTQEGETTTPAAPAESPTITQTPTAQFTPTPQPYATPVNYGPDKENFPSDINPLSGQQVKDPGLMGTPAVAISISHFPVAARPQAGLSFAPWVFEFYITEGATRFLSIFYGAFPEPETPVTGDCEVRREPYTESAFSIGNRIWLDENQNGRREDYEKGIGGICVNLLDGSGSMIQQTISDSNGYYGFLTQPGRYTVEFKIPTWLKVTQKNVGDENKDSDADQASGKAEAEFRSTPLSLDAGLILSDEAHPPVNLSVPKPPAEVGPIRSGRLFYIDIHNLFLNSCFIFASASPEILPLLPQCYLVPHDEASGGAMMSIDKMKSLAEENRQTRSGTFNYASNVFSNTPPEGGTPASKMETYVALLNQSAWEYDPLSSSYWRYVDDTTQANAGVLHPEIDRLTSRQLQFENIIVLFVEQEVYEYHGLPIRTLVDTKLELGSGGFAHLFRDGMKYDIRWSTKARAYEKETGQARPIYFLNADGEPVPLKPGRTWFFIATPYSYLTDLGNGRWNIRYVPPEGIK